MPSKPKDIYANCNLNCSIKKIRQPWKYKKHMDIIISIKNKINDITGSITKPSGDNDTLERKEIKLNTNELDFLKKDAIYIKDINDIKNEKFKKNMQEIYNVINPSKQIQKNNIMIVMVIVVLKKKKKKIQYVREYT